MNFIRTKISDVVIIEPKVYGDDRGYFVETFRQDKLESFLGYKLNFCQDNESKSSYGVLRGLHYQLPPFSQTKLIRVIEGRVLDIAVDIRQGSKTFGKYVSVELTSKNRKQMFVPRGFAHGFVVLSEHATVAYKVDNYYAPECDSGIAYDDPALGVNWLVAKEELQLSDKDINQPLLSSAEIFDYTENFYG